jgi:hypothetical protein
MRAQTPYAQTTARMVRQLQDCLHKVQLSFVLAAAALGGAARSPARSCAVINSAAADDAVLVAINVTGVVTTALVHQRSVASLQRSSVCTCDASVMAAASHSDALLRNINLTCAMARQQSFCTRAMAPRHTSAQPQ